MSNFKRKVFPLLLLFVLFNFLQTGLTQNKSSKESDTPTQSARWLTEVLQHEQLERTYHIYFPPGYSKQRSAPLVLALHGGGGRAQGFNLMTTKGTIVAAAAKRGVVLVFPNGVNKHWNDGRTLPGKKKYDDVGYLSRMIDRMVNQYGIDARRVYSTGISNGGFMSIRLAMDLSDKITAIAPVTAQLSRAIAHKKPEHPVSMMIINGTKDPLVPYEGGHIRAFFGRSRGEILSTEETVKRFREHNGCQKNSETVKINRDPDDKTEVEIVKYTGGKKGTEVVHVKVIGGGHTWPGGMQYFKPRLIGVVSNDINASELILDFFMRHSR